MDQTLDINAKHQWSVSFAVRWMYCSCLLCPSGVQGQSPWPGSGSEASHPPKAERFSALGRPKDGLFYPSLPVLPQNFCVIIWCLKCIFLILNVYYDMLLLLRPFLISYNLCNKSSPKSFGKSASLYPHGRECSRLNCRHSSGSNALSGGVHQILVAWCSRSAVRVSVCLIVYQYTITFEQNDLRPRYLTCCFNVTLFRSGSQVKLGSQSSRLQ